MAGFIYYVPSEQSRPPDELRYAFDGEVSARSVLRNGPDGNSGTLFAQDRGDLGYYPERQTWRRIGSTDIWFGWDLSSKPSPQDLKRKRQLKGREIELEDGQNWLLPIACTWFVTGDNLTHSNTLPRMFTGSDEGEWVLGAVVDSYKDLWTVVEEFWRHRFAALNNDSEGVVDLLQMIKWCVTCIETNYRISNAEIMALDLLSTRNFNVVLQTLVDDETFMEMQDSLEKKSTQREISDVERLEKRIEPDVQTNNRRSVPFDASLTV